MESLVFKTQSERNIRKQRWSRSCGNYLNFGRADFTCCYIQISAHKSGRDNFREDYKREQRYLKGEVTVYLSLVFILLISFAGAMLESASLQNVKNYRRADMTRAVYLQSIRRNSGKSTEFLHWKEVMRRAVTVKNC